MDDFGGKLRQARERRGISLRQIAASTKISAAALEALERNDISKLPGGIFSRAFVRSYAIEVGLDPDDTVREFLERFNQDPAPTAETAAAAIPEEEREFQERQRKATRIAIAAVAALALIGVALVFAYRARVASRARPPQPAAQESPAASAAASAPDTPPVQPAQPPPSVPLPKAADTPPPSVSSAKAADKPPQPRPLRLEIKPTADCWVSITVDGKTVLDRVMPAGEKQSFTVAKEAIVEIGDAGAFAYAINGKPGKSLGDTGQVRTLKLTPTTADQYIR
jgi:cytoskeletal protein RodZ